MERNAIVWIFQEKSKREYLNMARKKVGGNHERETESLQIAAQKDFVRTNYVKAKIDKTQQNSKCTFMVKEMKDQSYNKRIL